MIMMMLIAMVKVIAILAIIFFIVKIVMAMIATVATRITKIKIIITVTSKLKPILMINNSILVQSYTPMYPHIGTCAFVSVG